MEEKLNNSHVVALSPEETREINAGSQRRGEKLNNWFEKMWMLFTS
ncbi:hypothetical protein MUB18_10930 [Sphingobacterium sp. PCS056]|nr:hypothetical protein [Sphingobacterium sp. PCS056]UPZ34623.1 hypothetical protein MUB18_10930 [Sphingobacterium sp. PCS056]